MTPTQAIARTIVQTEHRTISPAQLAALIVENLEAFGYRIDDTIPEDEQASA